MLGGQDHHQQHREATRAMLPLPAVNENAAPNHEACHGKPDSSAKAVMPCVPLQFTMEVDVQPEADALWMPIVVALVGDVDDINVLTWERRVVQQGETKQSKNKCWEIKESNVDKHVVGGRSTLDDIGLPQSQE